MSSSLKIGIAFTTFMCLVVTSLSFLYLHTVSDSQSIYRGSMSFKTVQEAAEMQSKIEEGVRNLDIEVKSRYKIKTSSPPTLTFWIKPKEMPKVLLSPIVWDCPFGEQDNQKGQRLGGFWFLLLSGTILSTAAGIQGTLSKWKPTEYKEGVEVEENN